MTSVDPATPLDGLRALEVQLDHEVERVAIGALPLRAPLAFLHAMLDNLAFGDRMTGGPPQPERYEAGVGRLFGTWAALRHCPVEMGGTYQQALEMCGSADDIVRQLQLLMGYGHLCELMPEVHAGVLNVSGDHVRGFALSHASAELQRFEVLDYMLLALGSPMIVGPMFLDPECAVSTARRGLVPHKACNQLRAEGARRREQYVRLMEEPPLLTSTGFTAATGATRNEFRRVQAALFALADIHVSLANTHYGFRLRPGSRDTQDSDGWRAMEYASAAWPWEALLDWLAHVAAADRSTVERLLSFFAFDPASSDARMVGDGYWPPLTRIGDEVLIAPALLRRLLMERNILYALNRTDPQRLEDLVSRHLEPQLLDDFQRLFERDACFQVAREIAFPGGEIDLAVYDASSNTVLQCQAKAALPPQGARMTSRVQQRALEGLRQLRTFRDLDPSQREETLGRAFGRSVCGAELHDALLTRSCLGRAPLWTAAEGVALLSPSLLALLGSRRRVLGGQLEFRTLADDGIVLLEEMAGSVSARWTVYPVLIGDHVLDVPMLDTSPDVMTTWRIRAVAARIGRDDLAARPMP